MFKLKILILGPCNSGKTSIANFLSDATENFSGDYHPTQGVRIIEFESPNLNINNRFLKADVELWDCSGDHKFEACWSALQRNAQGIAFVYNPSNADHPRELEVLYNYFVTQGGLSPRNCIVFTHIKDAADKEIKHSKLSSTFSRVVQVATNVEESATRLRADFNNFLGNILGGLRERNDQEELHIMNMQHGYLN